eukprot:scaffold26621_cov120-Skeletonema_marinoi.AAC.1
MGQVGAILREAGVDYVKVSYEQLYNADNADEWMKIFRFLRVGPMEDLTVDDVRATFNLASTHSKGRNETVTNFIGVENTLKGTEFEHFLLEFSVDDVASGKAEPVSSAYSFSIIRVHNVGVGALEGVDYIMMAWQWLL